MSVASSIDYLKALKKTVDAIYQSIGRRTIIKYADFTAWNVYGLLGWPAGGPLASVNVDGTKLSIKCRCNGSMAASRTCILKKVDLTGKSSLVFDMAVGASAGGASIGVRIGVSTTLTPGTFSGTMKAVANGTARGNQTVNVSGLTGMHYIVVQDNISTTTDSDSGMADFYSIKLDGVELLEPHKADNSNSELKLSTSNTFRVYSPLITGSFSWDTLQGTWDKTYGSITVNVLNESYNVLISDVKDLSSLAAANTVEKVIIEIVLTGTPAQSPIAKDIWISYLS